MYIRSIFASAAVALALPMGAMAQDANAALCHHAGLTYSSGSMTRMGQALLRCELNEGIGIWATVIASNDSEDSANCISGGREFSQGTVLVAGSSELVCRNGIWFKN